MQSNLNTPSVAPHAHASTPLAPHLKKKKTAKTIRSSGYMGCGYVQLTGPVVWQNLAIYRAFWSECGPCTACAC